MHRIRGQRVRIVPGKLPPRVLGVCDWARRTITIRRGLAGKLLLDTLLHECLHYGMPDLDESAVDRWATDVAEILWLHGYRRVESA